MAGVYIEGQRVWVPSAEESWQEARLIKKENNLLTVETIPQGETLTVDVKCCHPKEDEGGLVDDMTKLSYLHEPGVLNNLNNRYDLDAVYTYTGNILIAVNPFFRIPGLYDAEMKLQYNGMKIGVLSPHVFAIADTAYRLMIKEGKSQSILISGESGAGKTETTKLVMEYLAGVGGRSNDDGKSVESQVLECNPLLEAFGNAKTVRNSNSSRFGKFIEIQFDHHGRVSGAAIRSYLLERSRVVQISSPERNYHCFYQLCYGATAEEVKKYKLPETPDRAKLFHYLNQSDCFELEGKNSNKEEYLALKRSMDIMGLTEEEKDSIFSILSAVLHLGNIDFDHEEEKTKIQKHCMHHLQTVSELLMCDVAQLEESLTVVTRKVAGEIIKTPLDKKSACARRDTLAKNIYSKLFDWIVYKVNVSIGQDSTSKVFIGVLDIYGFEHFKHNSFEQFCINLANEKLQQHFNYHVLKMEQEEYTKEKIDWSYIDFSDNQDVLELVEGDRGILTLLDTACKLTTTTPEIFTRNLHTEFAKHSRFSFSRISKTDFTVDHYAGKVTYSTAEFISKNLDAVILEHQELLSNSSNQFVSNLYPIIKETRGSKFASLGKRFKQQLKELMITLNDTNPHYIRCVKPNSLNKPRIFQKKLVMEQLRSGGVLEAVRMCSAGFPTRRTFQDFALRFRLLAKDVSENLGTKDKSLFILHNSKLQNYQVGLTKVFLRAGQMAILESLRYQILSRATKKIQRSVRLTLALLRRKHAAIRIQKHWRAYICRKKYKEKLHMLKFKTVQKWKRVCKARKNIRRIMNATFVLRFYVKLWLKRKRKSELEKINAAITIQKIWRGHRVRKPIQCLKKLIRAKIARRSFWKVVMAIKDKTKLAPPKSKEEATFDSIRLMITRKLRENAEKQNQDYQKQILSLKAKLRKKDVEIDNLHTALFNAHKNNKKVNDGLRKTTASFVPLIVPSENVDIVDGFSVHVVKGESQSETLSQSQSEDQGRNQTEPNDDDFESFRKIPSESIRVEQVDLRPFNLVAKMIKREFKLQNKAKEEHARLKIAHENRKKSEVEEIEKLKNEINELQKQLQAKEDSNKSMHNQLENFKERLAGKDKLESQMRILTERLHFTSSKSFNKSTLNDKHQQEMVIKQVSENLGFTAEGHPLSAIVLYKALLHWKTFKAEKTNTFDHIIEMIRISTQGQNINVLCYWITNTSMLYYLIQFDYKTEKYEPAKKGFFGLSSNSFKNESEKIDVIIFKQQLATTVQRLFVTIRDKIKSDLNDVIASVSEPFVQPADSLEDTAAGSNPFRNSPGFVDRSSSYWRLLIKCLASYFKMMKENCVPHFFIFSVLSEVLESLNIKLFNGLMLRSQWCPCTYSNAETLDNGLANLDAWIQSLSSFFDESLGLELGELEDQMRHIKDATLFMLCDSKHSKTMADFCELCPNLNKNQLAHLCIWFQDDVYNARAVNNSVMEDIWKSKESSGPMLLHDEDRAMSIVEDSLYRMKPFDIDQFDPPTDIIINPNFEFLLSPAPSPSFFNNSSHGLFSH